MPTILCFSTVDWDYLWNHPQALMSCFARDGYRVVYVDTIGLRSPVFRDFWRIISRISNWLKSKPRGIRLTKEGVHVYSPLLLPFLNSRISRRINVEVLVFSLNRIISKIGGKDPILWIYLPTWTVLQCVQRIPHQMLVYNCIDALSQNPAGVSLDYGRAEGNILRKADLVITTSEMLYREKLPNNPRTHWVSHGVDSHWLEKIEPTSRFEMLDRPRIGFFGTIDHRLDLELLRRLAQAHKDWLFVLIGEVRCDISTLLLERNVKFLGSKPHSKLLPYLVNLDVFILPYVLDSFTQYIQPVKLFECLALGKPIVATRLPALEVFEEVVQLAFGFEEFDRALGEAICETQPELQGKRRDIARANSWEHRYLEILKHLEGGKN